MVAYHYLNGAFWINAQINSAGETCFRSRIIFLIQGYRRAAILVPSTAIYNLHEWFYPNFSLKKILCLSPFLPSPPPSVRSGLRLYRQDNYFFLSCKITWVWHFTKERECMVERGQPELSWRVASGLQKSALRNSYPTVMVAQRREKYPLGNSIFTFQSN